MKFSRRVPHSQSPNALAQLLSSKARDGTSILDLTESNPTHAGILYPGDYLAALVDDRSRLYQPQPFGMPDARECLAREYLIPVDRVILTASTSEAYSWLFKLLCDPGDEVLIPRPSYPLFEFLSELECVAAKPYGIFYDQGDRGWFIDFHSLKQAITPCTRAVILVNPNNPTGHFIRRHELDELLTLCERHNLALISDEVFADYLIEPAPDSVLTLRGIADFSLNGLSKLVGLPQMKLAWMITKRPMPELEIIADTYLSLGTPVQIALPALLGLREGVQKQIVERIKANLALLPQALRVEAGWCAIVPVRNEEETAEVLLCDHNVLVQPGFFYDFDQSGYVVVSLLTQPSIFAGGLEHVRKFCR